MDRQTLKGIQAKLTDWLQKFADGHGLVYQPGNLSYSDVGFRGRMTFVEKASEVVAQKRAASKIGVDIAIGDAVVVGGKHYTVSGFRGRSVLVRRDDNGREYRARPRDIVKADGTKAVPLSQADVASILCSDFRDLSRAAADSEARIFWYEAHVKNAEFPKTRVEVVERFTVRLAKIGQGLKDTGSKTDPIQHLNEIMVENLAEARMS
jgi:hypothetical protein